MTKGRYASDPEFREKVKAQSRAWYRQNRPPVRRPLTMVLESDQYAEISVAFSNERKIVTVPVYTSGEVALVLGISTQSVRLWERKQILPPATFETDDERDSGNRLYTYDQVREIFHLIPLLGEVVDAASANSSFAVALRRAWARMPDGVALDADNADPPENAELPIEAVIYALLDSRDGHIHYVGQTVDPDGRYKSHLANAATVSSGEASADSVEGWIAGLAKDGLQPELLELDRADPSIALQVETEWIWELRDAGEPLKNTYPLHRPANDSNTKVKKATITTGADHLDSLDQA